MMPVATLKDIAARVGVSAVTVSNAIRNKGRVSAEMRKTILDAATELNYRPNAQAQSIRSGRTGVIGMIYSSDRPDAFVPSYLMHGVCDQLDHHGYQLLLGRIKNADLGHRGRIPGILEKWLADGLLINNQIQLGDRVNKIIAAEEVPTVRINSKHAYCCVYCDDHGAARDATERLLGMGHTQIAYLDYTHDASKQRKDFHYSVTDRRDGYIAAMERAGLTPHLVMADQPMDKGARAIHARQWLQQTDRPTAILCYGTGHQTIVSAAADLRVKVPTDLSIITFASKPAAHDHLVMASQLQPYEAVGAQSVDMLMEQINGAAAKPKGIAVPYTFEPGNTIALQR